MARAPEQTTEAASPKELAAEHLMDETMLDVDPAAGWRCERRAEAEYNPPNRTDCSIPEEGFPQQRLAVLTFFEEEKE